MVVERGKMKMVLYAHHASLQKVARDQQTFHVRVIKEQALLLNHKQTRLENLRQVTAFYKADQTGIFFTMRIFFYGRIVRGHRVLSSFG